MERVSLIKGGILIAAFASISVAAYAQHRYFTKQIKDLHHNTSFIQNLATKYKLVQGYLRLIERAKSNSNYNVFDTLNEIDVELEEVTSVIETQDWTVSIEILTGLEKKIVGLASKIEDGNPKLQPKLKSLLKHITGSN